MLRIAPGAGVTVAPAGGSVGVRARPSAIARPLVGVAAVNGGYFAADGNPVGVLAHAGALISEPVGGRSALALGGGERRVTAPRFAGSVTIGDETRLLDGVNRRPGNRAGVRRPWRGSPDGAARCRDHLHRSERARAVHGALGRPRALRRVSCGGARWGRYRAGPQGHPRGRLRPCRDGGGRPLSGRNGRTRRRRASGPRARGALAASRRAHSPRSSVAVRGCWFVGASGCAPRPRASRRSRLPGSTVRSWPPDIPVRWRA